ncbi:auxin-responsive protein SAUR32-like [Curcuma longa]|uniref:auxin-responsive protein SAUR32-like n=1 Tax=Curcuma longa TaxID=136217 RepID=UPI003D9DC935
MPNRAAPAKGRVTVRVGEEQQRFAVPVEHLSHPLFAALLEEAAEEYGFTQTGAIAIPCPVDHFRRVKEMIERRYGCADHRHHHVPFNLPIWK